MVACSSSKAILKTVSAKRVVGVHALAFFSLAR
jgi:hypothetical protein